MCATTGCIARMQLIRQFMGSWFVVTIAQVQDLTFAQIQELTYTYISICLWYPIGYHIYVHMSMIPYRVSNIYVHMSLIKYTYICLWYLSLLSSLWSRVVFSLSALLLFSRSLLSCCFLVFVVLLLFSRFLCSMFSCCFLWSLVAFSCCVLCSMFSPYRVSKTYVHI